MTKDIPGLLVATDLMAARMLAGGGDVNTAPATAALSIPQPTKPEKNNGSQYRAHIHRMNLRKQHIARTSE